ncbi:MAG: porin family protein [Candidatus Delongbacteria bacterium]
MNNKIKYIFLLLISCAFNASADMDYIIKNYGIKSGISISNQDLDISEQSLVYPILGGAKFLYRPGFTGGIFVEWFDEKYINLVTELNFSQKGTIYDTNALTNRVYNNRMDYLSIPVLAKFKYPEYEFLPYFLFGFRYDYLLNSSIETCDFMSYENAKTGNVGTTLGIGFEFDAGGFPMLLEYKYHNQYASLLENEELMYSIRNKSHSLVLGYRFKDIIDHAGAGSNPDSRGHENFKIDDQILNDNDFMIFDKKFTEEKPVNNEFIGFSRNTLIFRSMLIPGSAHISTKRYYAGGAYALLFCGALYNYIYRIVNYNDKIDRWHEELQKITPETFFYDYELYQKNCNDMKDEINDYEKTVYWSLGAVAAVYITNIIDAVIFAPEDQMRITNKTARSSEKQLISIGMEFDL